MDWETVELMGYAYYSEKGYRILAPLVVNHSYDFVAEKDGLFVRVNVKKAGLKSKLDPNSWAIYIDAGAARGPINEVCCDVYLAWVDSCKRFIEIDGRFFIGSKSKSKIIPKSLF